MAFGTSRLNHHTFPFNAKWRRAVLRDIQTNNSDQVHPSIALDMRDFKAFLSDFVAPAQLHHSDCHNFRSRPLFVGFHAGGRAFEAFGYGDLHGGAGGLGILAIDGFGNAAMRLHGDLKCLGVLDG